MAFDPTDPRVQAKLAELDRLEQLEREADLSSTDYLLRVARRDFRHFLEYACLDEETNENVRLAEIHRQWVDHINFCWAHGIHAIILAPWGHGKTSIVEMLPLFLWGHDQSLRIKIACSNDDLAKARTGKIRDYIVNSEEYHTLFPAVRPNETSRGWTEHSFFIQRDTKARDSSLDAKAITSHITGGRADVIIYDDINDEKNTIINPKDRDKVWLRYRTAFMKSLVPDGRVVFIGTRWHDEDVFGLIIKDAAMRRRYGILVQRIYPDCRDITCEFYYPETAKPSHGRLDHLLAAVA